MTVLGAPVFPHGNLAFFVAIFSEMTPRQINYLCASGRIPGAVKMAGVWLIPKTAEKPVDGRTKQGKVQKA